MATSSQDVADAPAADRPGLDRLRKTLQAYMTRNGLRSTEQRRQIIDTFFDGPEHVTIDEVLARVAEKDRKIGYATVYRTMKMLSEAGVAHERKFGDGFTRFELADEDAHHDHLICSQCGMIQEFEEPLIEQLQDRVAERFGFQVQFHKHELYGLCRRCQSGS